MTGIKRGHLTRVEIYDGNKKRPKVNQLSGEDSTVSQAFWVGQKLVSTSGTPEQLPDKAINPGVRAVIKAKIANVGKIYIGYDTVSADKTATTTHSTLVQGESIAYSVDNFKRIFIDADNSADGVELTLV